MSTASKYIRDDAAAHQYYINNQNCGRCNVSRVTATLHTFTRFIPGKYFLRNVNNFLMKENINIVPT